MPKRSIGWSKLEPFGAEFAEIEIEIDADRLVARGVAIGSVPSAYRLDYELETGPRFVTERFTATARGNGWTRSVELRDLEPDVLDVDLGLSPLFNTPPVLRHGLLKGGSADLVMAWVSVPDLVVHRSTQRYTFVRVEEEKRVVRFESEGFTADIVYDADGFVLDYPGIATRIG